VKNRGLRFRLPPALAVVAALSVGGCGPVRYPTGYVLNLQPTASAEAWRNGSSWAVVRDFQCPEYLCEGRIVYRTTPEQVGFYEYHRWVMSPQQMITQFVAATVRDRGLFKMVTEREPGVDAAVYVLAGSIEQLEEVDEGHDVHAVCVLSAQLIDAGTKSVLWSHRESVRVPVADRNVAGVVDALSAAAAMAVNRLVTSMETALTSAHRTR
jgi:ABC-type uncharacterized transport system auxiliary subunit